MTLKSRVTALAALFVSLLAGAGLISPAPAGATVRTYASTSHPFSNPVWYPVAVSSVMDCMRSNPGCPGYHPYWGWDIRVQNDLNHQKVYAMGAGIVHIISAHKGCGSPDENRGNSLYINHGGGVISMYSHLNTHFLVKDGDYVSARTPIAYASNSGYNMCKTNTHLRFVAIVVEHNARRMKDGQVTGTYVQVKHTYSCVHGHKAQWPRDLPQNHGQWTRWNEVPKREPVPATSSKRSCIPMPATATQPSNTNLVQSSKSGMRAGWSSASAGAHVTSVKAELWEYHPSIKQWMPAQTQTLSRNATRAVFYNLDVYHQFRFRVSFGNRTGWSMPSTWRQRGFIR